MKVLVGQLSWGGISTSSYFNPNFNSCKSFKSKSICEKIESGVIQDVNEVAVAPNPPPPIHILVAVMEFICLSKREKLTISHLLISLIFVFCLLGKVITIQNKPQWRVKFTFPVYEANMMEFLSGLWWRPKVWPSSWSAVDWRRYAPSPETPPGNVSD